MKTITYFLALSFACFACAGVSHNAEAASACMTPTGIHPLPPSYFPPGGPCGNGVNDFGVVVYVPDQFEDMQRVAMQAQRVQQIAEVCQGAGNGYAIAGCAAQQSGMLNEDGQIIAACAGAGAPYAIAVCAASGMTVTQLAKCANGIGVSSGCFGPTNDITRAVNGIAHEANRFGGCVGRLASLHGC